MISVLDCTLRDGGYVNNWEFPTDIIGKTVFKLDSAGIDVIECGYLNYTAQKEHDSSIYQSMEKISETISDNITDTSKLAVMINYGEYPIEKLPNYHENFPKIIRIAFHKKDSKEAMLYCKQVKAKGYMIFLQPMVTLDYSDRELLYLFDQINELKPVAAYIVDSFGSMRKPDIRRIASLYNHNIDKEIAIGFHAHNSLQLAFSNALEFIDITQNRQKCFVDVSVFGIGRGAGNLCSELMTQYLIENMGGKYTINPILEIMDEYLLPLYLHHPWGYSAAYYLSAIKKCHPNYAAYLMSKQTLTINAIEKCISSIPRENRSIFDKKIIEHIYEKYQTLSIDDSADRLIIKNLINGKTILLIGPGRNVAVESDKIIEYIQNENPFVIAINYLPKIHVDSLFVSNQKRYALFDELPNIPVIFTSNVLERPCRSITLNYSDLLNSTETSSDNAGLMLIKFLIEIGIKEIALAGFDGYNNDPFDNYFTDKLIHIKNEGENYDLKNKDISDMLCKYATQARILFVTGSIYDIMLSNERYT